MHYKIKKSIATLCFDNICAAFAFFILVHLNTFLKAMTSNAELVAFDDDKDKAILQFKNGKVFTCPSRYVAVPMQETLIAAKVSLLVAG